MKFTKKIKQEVLQRYEGKMTWTMVKITRPRLYFLCKEIFTDFSLIFANLIFLPCGMSVYPWRVGGPFRKLFKLNLKCDFRTWVVCLKHFSLQAEFRQLFKNFCLRFKKYSRIIALEFLSTNYRKLHSKWLESGF